MLALYSIGMGKEFTINLVGNEEKENFTINVPLEVDGEGKVIPFQKFHLASHMQIPSLKVITAPGLQGTMVNEREIIVFYKTSLNVAGMKIRNLYKVGVGRLYYDENKINITFDNDYYQNIYSFLNYHNVKRDHVKDLDNVYMTWEKI